jgi:hypothetical protein
MSDDESTLAKNPVPDAAMEDEAPDALKDADTTSGKVGTEEAYPPRKGEGKEASDTTPQEAGSF